MTEPVDVLIQAALLTKLCGGTAATSDVTNPVTPVALPLITYPPVAGTAYLDARAVLRAEPNRPGIGFTGSVIRRGIFQVDAVVPDNKGEAPGLRLAALVAARFAIGTMLVAGSYKLQLVKEPTIAAAVKDAPWVRFPVSIPYLVIT